MRQAMNPFVNILVVIDPSTEDQKALKRAIELTLKNNSQVSQLTMFLCVFDLSYELTSMLSSSERDSMRSAVIESREDWLNSIIDTLPHITANICLKVVWHRRPYEVIIEEVIHNQYDLVIKGTHQHDTLKSIIFTPTDWHLLRKCPAPLLLVKDHNWPKNGDIIAAVNIGSDEEEHQSLNNKITESAQYLAHIIEGNVHLVNAFPGTPVNISIEIPEFDSSEYTHTMRNQHEKSMLKHAITFSIEPKNTHVAEGLPEIVIAEITGTLDAELVVLGTIGRTGLSAALIGNTAEHVIDNLNCDLLAIKPEGYVSPLQKQIAF